MPSSGAVFRWVVEIAGLARTGTSSVRPFAASTSSSAAQPANTRCDVWQPAIVPGSVRLGPLSVNPMGGDPKAGTLSFQLVLNGSRWPSLSRFFLASRAAREASAFLFAGGALFDVNERSTWARVVAAPRFASLAAAGIVENSVIYIGRQAYRVSGSPAGSDAVVGWYDIVPTPAAPQSDTTWSLQGVLGEIGHIGTTINRHEARTGIAEEQPPVADDRVWTLTPFVRGREVTLLYGDDTLETERVWGRYVIDSDPMVSDDGTTIEIECVDALALLRRSKLGRDSVPYRITAISTAGTGIVTGTIRPQSENVAEYRAATLRPRIGARPSSRGAAFALQLGKYAVPCDRVYGVAALDLDGSSIYTGDVSFTSLASWSYGGDQMPTDEIEKLIGEAARELLVSDPFDGSTPHGIVGAPGDHPYFALDAPDLARPGQRAPSVLRHPLLLLLAHLGQYDTPNLPAHWRVPIPRYFVRRDEIERLAATTYAEIDEWPGVVAGYDGAEEDAHGWLHEQFLQPIAAGLGMSRTDAPDNLGGGRLTVRSLLPSSAQDTALITEAVLLPGRGGVADTSSATDAVVVTTGHGVGRGERLKIVATDLYLQRLFPYQSSVYAIKAPGIMHPDARIDEGTYASARVRWLRGLYQTVASIFRYPLMISRLSIIGSRLVWPGEHYVARVTGSRSDVDGSVVLSGAASTRLLYILSRDIGDTLAGAMTQTVEAMVMPWDFRVIGPAARVTAVVSPTVLEFAAAEFVVPLDGAGAYSPTGAITVTTDVAQFAAGQVARVRNAALDKIGAALTVASVDVPNRRITFGGAHGVGAPSAQVLTLASFTVSNAPETALYAYGDRNVWTA